MGNLDKIHRFIDLNSCLSVHGLDVEAAAESTHQQELRFQLASSLSSTESLNTLLMQERAVMDFVDLFWIRVGSLWRCRRDKRGLIRRK